MLQQRLSLHQSTERVDCRLRRSNIFDDGDYFVATHKVAFFTGLVFNLKYFFYSQSWFDEL